MHKLVIIGMILLTASLFGIATLNNIISHAMAQEYDNNYYPDNKSYSKYPTEDKNYKCKTGSLEGFFVSSVEFCSLINSMMMIIKMLIKIMIITIKMIKFSKNYL